VNKESSFRNAIKLYSLSVYTCYAGYMAYHYNNIITAIKKVFSDTVAKATEEKYHNVQQTQINFYS